MDRTTRAGAAAVVAGGAVLTVAGVVAWSSRGPSADSGWFAYAPVNATLGPPVGEWWAAGWPGPLALLLAAGLVAVTALGGRRRVLPAVLAAAAVAAALAEAPGLNTPLGSAGIRLLVVLAPAAVALGVHSWLSRPPA